MPKPKAGKSISPARSGRPPSKSPTNKNKPGSKTGDSAASANSARGSNTSGPSSGVDDLPPPAGYLITCDIPTKQFILSLNAHKEPADKKFVLQDLDATHVLVKQKAKDEILREVEEWENSNVYSAIEKMGEDFDMS